MRISKSKNEFINEKSKHVLKESEESALSIFIEELNKTSVISESFKSKLIAMAMQISSEAFDRGTSMK